MKTLYQIVGVGNDGALLTRDELLALCPVDDQAETSHLRPELRGAPTLKNMCGPMWGGWRDDAGEHVFLTDENDLTSVAPYSRSKGPITAAVVRYETWKAYDRLSR